MIRMKCYIKILRILWTKKMTNTVLQDLNITENSFTKMSENECLDHITQYIGLERTQIEGMVVATQDMYCLVSIAIYITIKQKQKKKHEN